jgi:mono/diheme cytochrome c family protein
MQSKYIGLIIVGIGVAAVGCTPKEEAAPEQKAAPAPAPEPAEVAEADPTAEAAQIFEDRCAVCHGMSGRGDGEGSAALDPKPRDFTNPEWQESVTDDHIQKIIVYGGLGVGKSATMPANPDLDSKPAVVKELVAYVRDLAK